MVCEVVILMLGSKIQICFSKDRFNECLLHLIMKEEYNSLDIKCDCLNQVQHGYNVVVIYTEW